MILHLFIWLWVTKAHTGTGGGWGGGPGWERCGLWYARKCLVYSQSFSVRTSRIRKSPSFTIYVHNN